MIYGIAFVVSCAFASVFLAIASFVCVRYITYSEFTEIQATTIGCEQHGACFQLFQLCSITEQSRTYFHNYNKFNRTWWTDRHQLYPYLYHCGILSLTLLVSCHQAHEHCAGIHHFLQVKQQGVILTAKIRDRCYCLRISRSKPRFQTETGCIIHKKIPNTGGSVKSSDRFNRENLAGQNLTGSWYDAADFDWYLIN